jgi:hypothetical protein
MKKLKINFRFIFIILFGFVFKELNNQFELLFQWKQFQIILLFNIKYIFYLINYSSFF